MSEPGTYKAKSDIRFQGFRRTFLLHIPERYERTRPLPLVIVLHGAFSTAQEVERRTGFSELADRLA